jgi:hypothetical protein
MDFFSFDTNEHYLVGTLLVRVVRRKDQRPLAGVRASIGGSEAEACGKG